MKLVSESVDQFITERWLNQGRTPFKPLTVCPLCGEKNPRFLFSKWNFDHMECRNCDLIFLSQEPVADFLDDLYENFEYFTAKTKFIEQPRLARKESFNFTLDVDKWYQSIVDFVLPQQQKGMWLDLGGGTGRFLHFINNYAPNFDTYLCESNRVSSRLAEEHFGIKTISWEEIEKLEGVFQVISCIAVFEHIPDSIDFINKLGKCLAPGGILYMTMPRLGRLSRDISKIALYDAAPPMHLRFFSEKSMRHLEKHLDVRLSLHQFRQTHGKTFHFGHIFKPSWYQLIDVVPAKEGDIPTRVTLEIPKSPMDRFIYFILNILDRLFAPVFQMIDGQRVFHVIWRKN